MFAKVSICSLTYLRHGMAAHFNQALMLRRAFGLFVIKLTVKKVIKLTPLVKMAKSRCTLTK